MKETKMKVIYENGDAPAAFADVDINGALESVLEFFDKLCLFRGKRLVQLFPLDKLCIWMYNYFML